MFKKSLIITGLLSSLVATTSTMDHGRPHFMTISDLPKEGDERNTEIEKRLGSIEKMLKEIKNTRDLKKLNTIASELGQPGAPSAILANARLSMHLSKQIRELRNAKEKIALEAEKSMPVFKKRDKAQSIDSYDKEAEKLRDEINQQRENQESLVKEYEEAMSSLSDEISINIEDSERIAQERDRLARMLANAQKARVIFEKQAKEDTDTIDDLRKQLKGIGDENKNVKAIFKELIDNQGK